MRKAKYIFCGHGLAGRLGLWRMLTECAIPAGNILAFTYDDEESRPLRDALEQNGVEYHLTPLRGRKARARVEEFSPDLIVSVYYRHRIPGSILSLARRGGINLHPSLLPNYRGALSGVWAIINGEPETGISWHFMDEEFDKGPIVLQEAFELHGHETGYSLFHKLVDAGICRIGVALDLALDEEFSGQKQKGEGSYYSRELPFGGSIDPGWPREQVHAFVRALTFPGKPGARLLVGKQEYEIDSIEDYDQALEALEEVSVAEGGS